MYTHTVMQGKWILCFSQCPATYLLAKKTIHTHVLNNKSVLESHPIHIDMQIFLILLSPQSHSNDHGPVLQVKLYKIDIFKVKNISHFGWLNPKTSSSCYSQFMRKENVKLPEVESLPSHWNGSLKCKVSFRKRKVLFLAQWIVPGLRLTFTSCRGSSSIAQHLCGL